MPVMDGGGLIEALKEQPLHPVVMVLTSANDSKTIIDIMGRGVVDYILKPARKDDLRFKIDRAMENAKLNHIANQIEKEKLAKLKVQQHWSKYFGKLQTQTLTKQSIFRNLHTHFNQGEMFGIPHGFESRVEEPFFRLNKYMYEAFHTLDFGLGLPMVDQIALKFDGSFEISNLQDYTSEEVIQHVVNAEMLLPLMDESQ